MGGCIQCRKQKEQSTKNFSFGDTFSWLDSDCSMDDSQDFYFFDEEIKSKIQKKFYPQKQEKINKQQEQLQFQIQEQQSNKSDNKNDILNIDQIQLEENLFQNVKQHEGESILVNQEIQIKQIQQNSLQMLQQNYKNQNKLKNRSKSFQEMKNQKLCEKNKKQLTRARSIGKYNDLPPFNQILYQVFVSYNQQIQQQNVQENEDRELKTKINCIQQQQKKQSSSDSMEEEEDILIPNKPMVFNSNLLNNLNQNQQNISIKQQNENLIEDNNNDSEDNNNDSDCDEIEYKCFCCQKSFSQIFQLNCLHQYNQRCLINQILNQINNHEKIISCLCRKQINNESITQVIYFQNITQDEQDNIAQFLQNVN